MKGLLILNHEWQGRYVASVVNTVKIYGFHIAVSYHYDSTNSTGITSAVVPSYWYFDLPTGELMTQVRQGSRLAVKRWHTPE